jgi:hypothetical protein
MLKLSPSFWNEGDIIWNSNGSTVAYTMIFNNLVPITNGELNTWREFYVWWRTWDKNYVVESQGGFITWGWIIVPQKSTPTRLTDHDDGHQPLKCWANRDVGVNNLTSSCSGIPNYFTSVSWRKVGVNEAWVNY